MKAQYDFKKEWDKTKIQLVKFSEEAMKMAKKGEKELVKLSKQGKLHVDATTLNLKKEILFEKIGKEYVKSKNYSKPSAKLKQLLEEHRKLASAQASIRGKLKKAGR